MRRQVLLASFVVSVAGCSADNAILELAVLVPAKTSPEPLFVSTQIRRARAFSFDEAWIGDDPAPIALEDRPVTDAISVVTEDDGTDLHLKVRFCTRNDCQSLDDSESRELRYVLEHPFYIGERTAFDLEIEDVPPTGAVTGEPIVVDRCAIKGCLRGSVSSYCRQDGRHYCERQ